MQLTLLPDGIDQALALAMRLGVLPSALGSAEQRDQFSLDMKGRALWSARSTNAEYLQAVREGLARIMQGGKDNDLATVRMELKGFLQMLGYTPETGFPGDDGLGIPPAEAGDLQDISSTRRIELVLKQNLMVIRGAGQKARGEDVDIIDRWPCWELVRLETRRVQRGTMGTGTLGWQRRWVEANGPLNLAGRLIAPKGHEIWQRLGDASLFRDALNIDHPPFAYNSGMGWRGVRRDEALAAGVELPEPGELARAANLLPTPEKSVRGMDRDIAGELVRRIKARRGSKPGHVRYNELLEAELQKAEDAGVIEPRGAAA